ncbi:NrdH-redoxin [Geomonas sp. Red32]|uniref:glutaredoxin domain-containing protein n=1 Tax=Geomonas sp. Red32 TaxID=2912856 RepID=UPI00202CEB26|nr:glutaredoxin domain-containing protein [Geomonas sp. Red32]MCM0082771.1 NrdH-redoxin [Geomonas sp. Red32]
MRIASMISLAVSLLIAVSALAADGGAPGGKVVSRLADNPRGTVAAADSGTPLSQSPLPARPAAQSYPKIVLYSVSWCPHCKQAKEYFTRNNIPFINRDVEIDTEAYHLLTGKYKSQGVPVIVIGDDAEVIRGFNEKSFQKTLDKYLKK